MNKLLLALAALAAAVLIACGGGSKTDTPAAPAAVVTTVPSVEKAEPTATPTTWGAEGCNTAYDMRCEAYHQIFFGLSTALYPDPNIDLSAAAFDWLDCAATVTFLTAVAVGEINESMATQLAQDAIDACGEPPAN